MRFLTELTIEETITLDKAAKLDKRSRSSFVAKAALEKAELILGERKK